MKSFQQALQQAVICILESAFNQFGLIRERGWKRRQINPLFLISILLLIESQITFGMSKTYFFKGENNNYPINLRFDVKKDNQSVNLNWKIKSDEFNEENSTTLKNERLTYCFQKSENAVDNEYFEWSITLQDKHYEIFFKNEKYNETFKAKIPASKKTTTLQGLLYVMQQRKLKVGDSFEANLLVPWKTIIPIKISITNQETIKIGNNKVKTLKANVELRSFIIGKVLPRSTIWVTEEYPHTLVKQKNFNKYYELIDEEFLSEELINTFEK